MFEWSNHTPETARAVAKAFYAGTACKRGNCETDGRRYLLHGNCIARRIPDDEIPGAVATKMNTGYDYKPLEFTFCGWSTSTTCRHLNALGVKATRYEGVCRMNGHIVDPRKWYELEDLQHLPTEVPKPPRKERFVNLTQPLFA